MERRYNQGFWLASNTLYEGTVMINAGHASLTVDVAGHGSSNLIDIDITNDDASFTFTGKLWANFYMRDGYVTEYSE